MNYMFHLFDKNHINKILLVFYQENQLLNELQTIYIQVGD
jgi:hypothetical protein